MAVAMVMVVTVTAVIVVNCMSGVTGMPVTVEAIGMAAQSIGMGTVIGMVAIGMHVAIGIGGTVDGGPMVLALVGEWFLAAGFGSVTDSALAIGDSNDADTASRMPLDLCRKGTHLRAPLKV